MRPVVIENYGPKKIIAGDRFNVQPNGYSAIWFQMQSEAEGDLIVQIDGQTLKTVCYQRLLTALLPDRLFQHSRKATISIFYSDYPDACSYVTMEIAENIKNMSQPQSRKEYFDIRRPNFFIIGAPRSGTTSMYWHLSSHPKIFMSKIKEPHFFSHPVHKVMLNSFNSIADYLSLFKYVPIDATVIGEASTTYLCSIEALQKIKEFEPKAKLLTMLRNPIQAAISLYLRMHEGGKYEGANNFNTAWKLCDQRDPKAINNYKWLFMIGNQIEDLLKLFNKTQVKVIFFDDILNDSISVYQDILTFLNLPLDKTESISKGNSAKWSPYHKVVSRATYNSMRDHFGPQIAKVSDLTNRNLKHWQKSYDDL